MENKQQSDVQRLLNVNKNVTLTTGRAISGQQLHVKRKWSQKPKYQLLTL